MMKIMKIAELIRTLESEASDEFKLKQIHHACDTDVITEEEAIELVCEYNVRKPIAKKLLADVDLKKQVSSIKDKWYYEQTKWGLKVNKHSVVFDNSMKFTLVEHETDLSDNGTAIYIYVSYVGNAGDSEAIPMYKWQPYYDYADCIYGTGRYCSKTDDILAHIVCYIANYV